MESINPLMEVIGNFRNYLNQGILENTCNEVTQLSLNYYPKQI